MFGGCIDFYYNQYTLVYSTVQCNVVKYNIIQYGYLGPAVISVPPDLPIPPLVLMQ